MNIAQLRKAAQEIWGAALAAASPDTCIRNSIQINDDTLTVCAKEFPLTGRVIVIGAGKASARMAQVVEELLGDRVNRGLVVTKYGHGLPLKRVTLVEAGHPIPDAQGVQAVQQMRGLLKGLTADDLVLCLISGGGSSLWPAPPAGITLEEKQEVTSLLLRAGAGIRDLNAVRKHLSEIKGGQLAAWAAPARVVSLIMSDVIGDPLDFIASGPTAADTTTFNDALEVLQRYGVAAPSSVMERFRKGSAGEIPDTPKPGDSALEKADNFIIANNRLLVGAAALRAQALGFQTVVLGTEVEGEAREIARFLAAIASEVAGSGNPVAAPACVLAAGETTVTVRGQGKGGRNQEMALAWAIAMHSRELPCCFASVASDGSDGPTDAAGGLVDPMSWSRAVASGASPMKCLEDNDSWSFLTASGDLIVTGPTQTNLMDLQILLVDNGDEEGQAKEGVEPSQQGQA
jgi:hydroxypyruvate reductase